jgi:hypothetical protein
LRRDEFLREAQCIKLLQELQTIYPIKSVSEADQQYLIRGLKLSFDINNTTVVPEEELSAALGFACHLVVMLSKYLSVQLRYSVFCNSSRSAIKDGTVVFPLFLARAVEREQLGRGMKLLDANVDSILKTRGIAYTAESHMLSKLKRVFDQVIEGEEWVLLA